MGNLETQTTLGTQDTEQINVTEDLGNIKNGKSRDRKHWVHKTQDK